MRRRGSDCVPPHHSKKLPDFSGSFFAGIKPYFLLLCLARLTLKIKSADFGLRGELPYIDAVIAAVNDEANLVEKEHKIDLIRWNEATELATFDYFDINTILSYLARVNIVARWTQLDAVRGREMFDRLMAELDGRELVNRI